ncbi:MAG: hydantoinase B/oxoprolinase family protein [Pseudomonadota bacterium]
MTAAAHNRAWRFWIDRGGTFTDVIAAAPDGSLKLRKLLSENPAFYGDAATEAVHAILSEHGGGTIAEARIGTTVATNALLERAGEKTALLITKGLRDVLEIGSQNRPDLFALNVQRPAPLYSAVYEIPERVSADGAVLTTLHEAAVETALQQAQAAGCTAVAICFIHALRYPAHEIAAARIAAGFHFRSVKTSHQASARHKLVPRGQTAVADAYLSPVLRTYVEQVEAHLGAVSTSFMKSDGGVTPAHIFQGKDAILSGPAGGIVGAVETAKAHSFANVIAFDMGGTSTDVAHYNGQYDMAEAPDIAGVKLDVPMLGIHTIAAGGGSILRYGDGRFQVGPQSAGAQPGPAAYGRGGPLTITDCHVLLGRLQPSMFPAIFGTDGKQPLDRARVITLFEKLRDEIDSALSLEAIAEGFLDVACEQMARAIKTITHERGIDLTGYALVAFGGAGGQCACRVAEIIGVKSVLLHPLAGLLSALGIGLSARTERFSMAIDTALAEADLDGCKEHLTEKACSALPQATLEFSADVRQRGADMTLQLDLAPTADMARAFETLHRQHFGFAPDGDIHIDAVHCKASEAAQSLSDYRIDSPPSASEKKAEVRAYFGAERTVTLTGAQDIKTLVGPAILASDGATTIVEPGWSAAKKPDGSLVLTHVQDTAPAPTENVLDPIKLEIFHHRCMAIAEQMGTVLERTAHSINIKERLDFSCALFDAHGALVANAPHVPVHLGSMGETVTALIARGAHFTPGCAFAHNDPYDGGTHLPDVTVVMPVFSGDAPIAYVASRGHHADIGGITPGSMPAQSTTIADEGVVFSALKILEHGTLDIAGITRTLQNCPHPARSIETNLADLKAQVAACQTGAAAIEDLIRTHGAEYVRHYMAYIQDNAAAITERIVGGLQTGSAACALEGIGTLSVNVTRPKERHLRIDFTGTCDQGAHNFNAPLAITKAAVLYVIRCLIAADIPLNAGCLRPIELIVPEGSLLNPKPPAAVVAGNVETSSAVTNLLFEALSSTGNLFVLAARATQGERRTGSVL